MDEPVSYEEIEEWLLSYSCWKARVRAIRKQSSFLPHFAVPLERMKANPNAKPSDLAMYQNMVRALENRQDQLPVYELRIIVLNTCLACLPECEQEFIRLRYIERLTSVEVQERLVISPSTFFRRRKSILGSISGMMGDAEHFLSNVLPDEERPFIPLFFSEKWFVRKNSASIRCGI